LIQGIARLYKYLKYIKLQIVPKYRLENIVGYLKLEQKTFHR